MTSLTDRVIKSFFLSWFYTFGVAFGVGVQFLTQEIYFWLVLVFGVIILICVECYIGSTNTSVYLKRRKNLQFIVAYITGAWITSLIIEKSTADTVGFYCVMLLTIHAIVINSLVKHARRYQTFELAESNSCSDNFILLQAPPVDNDGNPVITNNTLVLPGFNENLLESTVEKLQTLPFHSQKKTSHQVAQLVANHAKQDNGKQNLYCADPNRLKFIFYNGDEWFEDMNHEKTVRDVCKCILEKMGDPLGKQKKYALLADETNGYSGPLDLMIQKKLLDYQQDVSKTIRQIEACADDENEENDNDFAKDYLKKLASLVRGDAEHRNEARKLVK